MIMLNHRLRGHMMHLDSCSTTEILLVWLDLEPSHGFFTMMAQVRNELTDIDGVTLDEAKDLGLVSPWPSG